MVSFLGLFLHVLVSPFRSRASLEAEIVFLRHQLNVLRRQAPTRPRLTTVDRLIFVWLYRVFPAVLSTILRWHRAGFRLYWRWRSRCRGGRPKVPEEIRRLIREMNLAKPAVGRATHPW
jgi:hypothetical protein